MVADIKTITITKVNESKQLRFMFKNVEGKLKERIITPSRAIFYDENGDMLLYFSDLLDYMQEEVLKEKK